MIKIKPFLWLTGGIAIGFLSYLIYKKVKKNLNKKFDLF